MNAERLARWEARLRPSLLRLPPAVAVRLYSRGRRAFLARLVEERLQPVAVPAEVAREVWGIRFRSPLGNAAGMFKTGDGYALAAAQGAGYYLAGTTTGRPRAGNRDGVVQPFAPYPRSGAASNFLGLPNPGHRPVATRLGKLARVPGCPLGASLAAVDDDGSPEERLRLLVDGLAAYADAGVDFLEVNESCPNTGDGAPAWDALRHRLEAVAEGFLARGSRPPVVVKLSNDTEPERVPEVVDLLLDFGFAGVDFGNTSTRYAAHRERIDVAERGLYDRFTSRWGGGVSGRPLREPSLALASAAARLAPGTAERQLGFRPPPTRFAVLRTGGLESASDVAASLAAGASLCGWYTGYFEAFGRYGHAVYARLHTELAAIAG